MAAVLGNPPPPLDPERIRADVMLLLREFAVELGAAQTHFEVIDVISLESLKHSVNVHYIGFYDCRDSVFIAALGLHDAYQCSRILL